MFTSDSVHKLIYWIWSFLWLFRLWPTIFSSLSFWSKKFIHCLTNIRHWYKTTWSWQRATDTSLLQNKRWWHQLSITLSTYWSLFLFHHLNWFCNSSNCWLIVNSSCYRCNSRSSTNDCFSITVQTTWVGSRYLKQHLDVAWLGWIGI